MRLIKTHYFIILILNVVVNSSAIGQLSSNSTLRVDEVALLDQTLHDYQVTSLDFQSVKQSFDRKSKEVQFHLTLDKSHSWQLELTKNSLLSNSTNIRALHADGELNVSGISIETYHGKIAGMENSEVAVTISDDYFSAHVFDGTASFSIEPLKKILKGRTMKDGLIFFNNKDLTSKNKYHCKEVLRTLNQKKSRDINKQNAACRDLELSIAVDYKMYVDEGENINDILTSLAEVYNLVGLDYDDEFVDEITIKINEIIISTCADCDRWTGSTDVYDVLNSFQAFGTSVGFNESYDIGILWSTRGYDDNFAGLAFTDVICSAFAYIVVNKFSDHGQSLRAMISHEIGHVLGCGHNYEYGESCANNLSRPHLIMDPVVDPAVIGWSDGSYACSRNSIDSINVRLPQATCISSCESITCDPISELSVANVNQNGVDIAWTGTAPEYNVRIREQGTSQYILDVNTGNTYLQPNVILEYCKLYDVVVTSICASGNNAISVSTITEIPEGARFKLLQVSPKNCDGSFYDLEVVFEFEHPAAGGFMASINGQNQVYQYSGSPQTIHVLGLATSGNQNATLELFGLSNSDTDCNAYYSFTEPGSDCVISMKETFDNCELPYEWTAFTTSQESNYEWQFGNEDRLINNYGSGFNNNTHKSINGTCAAYFDDDLFMSSNFTGMITLESRAYDVSNMSQVVLSLTYNYHNFEDAKPTNGSRFQIDVYDGSQWTNIHYTDDDTCPFHNVWQNSCMTYFTQDVSSYINDQFKVRFAYTDGNLGEWTGMVMVDEFEIQGAQLPALDIKLLDFLGSLTNNGVELEWDVDNTSAVKQYEIFRSNDGTNFHLLTTISLVDIEKYIDIEPLIGDNYYKLVVTNENGRSGRSELVQINYNPSKEIIIYPNPSNQNIVSVLNTTGEEFHAYEIFNINGQRIQSSQLVSSRHINIDVEKLKEGIYILLLKGSASSKALSLIRL